MDNERIIIEETESICPVCLKRIKAKKVKYGDKVYLEKSCPEHGFYQTIIWNGYPEYESWINHRQSITPINCLTKVDKGCPYDCGICPEHRQHTCCVLLEITNSCNLQCPLCFASAKDFAEPDPSLEEISSWFDMLMRCGGPFNIQLSGGEPSLRDDIPEIIRIGREKGFSFFQLNTNGLRLAHERQYAKLLKEAGLNCVFLQFDALSENPYIALRGRKLLQEKLAAVKNCSNAGLSIVLVPTVVPGINDGEIGAILRFAMENMPHVRGVHFQPVSYFGRYPGRIEERMTIPDLLRQIEQQTYRQMKIEDFKPGTAENPYCSFNAIFLVWEDGTIKSLHKESSCCCSVSSQQNANEAQQAREFVAKQWGNAPNTTGKAKGVAAANSLDDFLERLTQYKLAVSGMAFQDAWNLDLDRLRDCYIHIVSPNKRIVPFCAYNLTDITGKALYRGD
ncbi:MAG: radical SAM (seleno)protein TrsS [Bacillota bacterium]|jgi:uncharacterized radical SAM superfamily Fe-S cluster-containing enzyme